MNGVRGGSGKGLCAEGYRRGIGAEYRVNEYAAAAELDEKGGMPKPQNSILRAFQCAQGGVLLGNRFGRNGVDPFGDKGAEKREDETAVVA